MPRLDWDDDAFERIVYKVRDYSVGGCVDEERLARWVQLSSKDAHVPMLHALEHFIDRYYWPVAWTPLVLSVRLRGLGGRRDLSRSGRPRSGCGRRGCCGGGGGSARCRRRSPRGPG